MTGADIIALIEEFFNIILNFLIAIGIIEAEETSSSDEE